MQLLKEIQKYQDMLIIVEGKKDKSALESLGFSRVFVINESGKSIYEKIEQIDEKTDKEKVCILTDFDKKGRQLYFLLKRELVEKGVKIDSSLRSYLLKAGLSHIEGIDSFVKTIEKKSNGKKY
jgi:5S rRNA maturation endonuclease (ribonuclease M5)